MIDVIVLALRAMSVAGRHLALSPICLFSLLSRVVVKSLCGFQIWGMSDGALIGLRPGDESKLSSSGRPPMIEDVTVVMATLTPMQSPDVAGWPARLLAAHRGISIASVARIWREKTCRP